MKSPLITFTLAMSLLLPTLSVQAETVFEENFNEYEPGPLSSSGEKWIAARYGAGEVTKDTKNFFGQGSSNQFLLVEVPPAQSEANVNDNTSYQLATKSLTSPNYGITGQISFDIYQEEQSSGEGLLVRLGGSPSNGATAFALFIKDGSLFPATGTGVNFSPKSEALASYDLKERHTVTLVYNNSSSAFAYGNESLAAESMDVYLNGRKVGTVSQSGGMGVDLDLLNLNLTAKSNYQGALCIDNIVATDTPTVQAN